MVHRLDLLTLTEVVLPDDVSVLHFFLFFSFFGVVVVGFVKI